MPWFMMPVNGAVFVCWVYGMVLAVLALLDMGTHGKRTWGDAGSRKSVWVAALLTVPYLSGAVYWTRVRPKLDDRLPADEHRPDPLLAKPRTRA